MLGLALGIELARQALLTANSRTFTLTQVILWFYVFATLLTTVALLGLFWFNLAYTTRSRWIGWIYLLVGLSAVLWIFIEFGMGVYLKVYLTIPVFLNNAMAPGSFFYVAAGGVARAFLAQLRQAGAQLLGAQRVGDLQSR